MSINLFATQSHHFNYYYSSAFHISTAQSSLYLFVSHNPTGYKVSWPHSFMDSSIKTNKTTHLHNQNHNQPNITNINNNPKKKEKLVIIMGATGTGKSRLSIDLGTHFPFCEIINSDKMQLYKGLDITTNKITLEERNGIPHHLLGEFEPSHGELSPSDFRKIAGMVVSNINSRRKLPILVGGSNSLIHALVVEKFDSCKKVFDEDPKKKTETCISSELRYDCCFLWVDVSFMVLSGYLSKRVEEMIDSGMFEELAEFYDVSGVSRTGLEKAIGVPEFDRYFAKFKPGRGGRCGSGAVEENRKKNDRLRRLAFEEAMTEVKENTFRLAKKQVWKIEKLRGAGWDLQKMDATEAFKALMMVSDSDYGKRWKEIWEKQVMEASVKIVKHFLEE